MLGLALPSHGRRGGLGDVPRSAKLLVSLSIEKLRSGFPMLPAALGEAWGQDSQLCDLGPVSQPRRSGSSM